MSYIKKVDKQATNVHYTGTFTGLSGGTEVQMEPASNIVYCKGTFGNYAGRGYHLSNATGNLVEGVDFAFDKRLDASTTEDATDGFGSVAGGIYDTSASGAYASGKFMRIRENAKNVKDGTGLNLKIYAKSSVVISPPSDRCYINPNTGDFVLPQPVYWSKMQSIGNITSAEIAAYSPYTYTYINYSSYINGTYYYGETVTGVKFGNGYYTTASTNCPAEGNAYAELDRYIYPCGTGYLNWEKGTISTWVTANAWGGVAAAGGTYDAYGTIVLVGSSAKVSLEIRNRTQSGARDDTIYLSVNSTTVASYSIGTYPSVFHVYMVWDYYKGLAGGKSVRVWINGTERLSTTANIPGSIASHQLICSVTAYSYSWAGFFGNSWSGSEAWIDNLKVFNHVASEDPAWEYNSGTGREDALHYIYGSGNGYKPSIIAANGVGYYYLAIGDSPAVFNLGSNAAVQLENANSVSNCYARFGVTAGLAKETYTAFESGTNFIYEKRLDASTTEDPTDGYGATAGGVIDTGISGALAANTSIRIVDGSSGSALNIKNVSGLDLMVYAKSLGKIESPIYDRCYVDPMLGKFVMPRPIFWSKMESLSSWTSSEIKDNINTYSEINDGTIAAIAGKFGNGLKCNSNLYYGADCRLIPNITSLYDQVTMSFWFNLSVSGLTDKVLQIGSDVDTFCLQLRVAMAIYPYYFHQLYINGTLVKTDNTTISAGWHHMYMLMDTTKSLAGGKSIRIFLDGVEITGLATDATISQAGTNAFTLMYYSNDSLADNYCIFDNYKIWKEIVTQDPAWEYNSGTGREDALHYIYGSSSGYKPVLVSPGGVGYFKNNTMQNNMLIEV